jgi:hypothetical protein
MGRQTIASALPADIAPICYASANMKLPLGMLAVAALVMLGCSKPAAKEASIPAALGDNLFVWDRPFSFPINLPIAQSTTCRFKKGLAVTFQKIITKDEPNPPERVYYSAGDEDISDTVSFLDLNTKAPKVQTNGGQASLAVVYDDGQRLTLLNDKAAGAEMYSIFRNKGVVIYNQQMDSPLIGPFGIIMMGYCN